MLIDFDYLRAKYKIKTPGVVHLGANTGQEAVAYAEQGIERVIWVEALQELIESLQRNIEPYPGQMAIKACLSDEDGKEVVFHVASNNGASSSFLELGTHAQEHPTVKYVRHIRMETARFDSIMYEEGLDTGFEGGGWFLNVDLQGAELLALKGMGELLWKFDYAYIEVNEKKLYRGCPLVADIDAYLGLYGLFGREVKMTGAGWGDKFYTRKGSE